ncbi:hypothetical protein AVEN_208478-1, partial [Araneus ventricosus]
SRMCRALDTPLDVQNVYSTGYSTGCPECVHHCIL